MIRSPFEPKTETMVEFHDGLLTAREAAAYLRVSLNTLGRMEQRHLIIPYRTPGGHRRYSLEMLRAYLESTRSA